MSWKHIFARKNLEMLLAEMEDGQRLHRVLGPVALTSLGVGCIIGAGIFVMTGRAAANDAGPAVTVSFAIAAVGCALAALCYAEFAAMAPVAGSAYTYTYATLGEVFAWIIGWDLILEYAMGCATVASAWTGYANQFLLAFGLPKFPDVISSDPFTPVEGMAGHPWLNFPSLIIMALVTTVLVLGIRESARTNALLVMIKLGVVLFVIGAGWAYINKDNWTGVPETARILPQERVIPGLVKDYLSKEANDVEMEWRPHRNVALGKRGWADSMEKSGRFKAGAIERTERNPAQLAAAVSKALAATYRMEWVREEANRLQQAGRVSAEQAQQMIRSVDEAASPQLTKDPGELQVVDELLPKVRSEGEKKATESWGLLGMIGLNHWLLPIDDATRSPFAPYGLSGIMLGAAIVFFAYIGFDSISTHAEEARRPQRDVPIGILVSLCLCTVLYILVAGVVTGMMPYPQIDVKAPIAVAFSHQAQAANSPALRAATALIAAGGLAGMTSVLLVLFLSQARIFMAMSRDGLLPKIFGTVHPRFRTPHIATLVTGVVICFVAALTPIYKLEEMVNVGTLMAFVMVCSAVLILRFQRPDAKRPFRCPLVTVVAPLGMLVNLTLMLFLPLDTWIRLVLWLLIGMVIYFSYSRRHSLLTKHLLHEIQTPRAEDADNALAPTGG